MRMSPAASKDSRVDHFRIGPDLNIDSLRAEFASQGRVRIRGFLAEEAVRQLADHLAARSDWRQMINSGPKLFELDREIRSSMTPARLSALDQAVHDGARAGFQHRYEAVRVPDEMAAREAAEDMLSRFVRFMASKTTLELVEQVTGISDIDFADGQATGYASGDFLTEHDDAVAGKNRRAAYVFGLTPKWRPSWGGLLLFHQGDRVSGWSPGFNTLDLFAVPQPHSVTMVTPAAAGRRHAVTGWLRAMSGN